MDDTPIPIAEIDHGPSKFEVFLDKNMKLIMAAAITIFLGVIAYVGYVGYVSMLNAEAGEALTTASEENALQAVITAHKDTASAAAASLLIADLKGSESADDAISLLNKFTSTYPNHAAIATATTSLGLRLMNEGKFAEAKDQLLTVIDLENAEHIVPIAQIALGDIAQLEGDDIAAKEYYTAVTDLISDDSSDSASIAKFSSYKALAGTRIRFIGALAPIEEAEKVEPIVPTAAADPVGTDSNTDNPDKTATTETLTEKKSTLEEKVETNSQTSE